jgi:hypothetical protein
MADTVCMNSAVSNPLIVAISSRALFDLEDSHALFEREGLEAYAAFQRRHEDELLAPGIAFPLVRKLLALNDSAPADAPRVEVILLSRNSSDTGLRIFNSIEHHRTRTSGRSVPTCSCRRTAMTCAMRWPPALPPRRSCPLPRKHRRCTATISCASHSMAMP